MTTTTTAPPTPTVLPMRAADVLLAAGQEIGNHEDPAGSNLQKYGQWYGFNGVPWCAMFVAWCFAHPSLAGGSRGVDIRSVLGGSVAYTPHFAARALAAGWARVQPSDARNGDVVFFDFADNVPRIQHVGFVLANDNRIGGGHSPSLLTIEGNTSGGNDANGGQVQQRTRSYSCVALVVRPPYTPEDHRHPKPAYTLHRTLRVRRLRYMRGGDVEAVQRLVGAHVDRVYGPDTAAKVAAWQRRVHIPVDGQFGPQSAKAAGWGYSA